MPLVKEAMTASLVTVPVHAVIDVAIDLMVEKSISSLPVVDEKERLVGIISEYDVLELFGQPESESLLFEPCEKYMTTNLKTISPDASLKTAATIFRAASLRRLLVVDDHRLVGVLSRRDVVRHIRDERDKRHRARMSWPHHVLASPCPDLTMS